MNRLDALRTTNDISRQSILSTVCLLAGNSMSGQSPLWKNKVRSLSEEWIDKAKTDTQQRLFICRDSEGISAAGHRRLTEGDTTHSVTFPKSLVKWTRLSLWEVRVSTEPSLIQSPSSTTCTVTNFKGGNMLLWKPGDMTCNWILFCQCSSLVQALLFLPREGCFKHKQKKINYLINDK